MSLPMLQVALDNQTLSHAYETTRLIAEEVDIIEVGTILCVGEGVRAVRDLKALYPHKIVLADAKIADAKNSTDFNDIHLFGDQAGRFIGTGQRLVVQSDL